MIDWLTYISIFFVVVPILLSALTYRAFKFSPPLFYLLSVGFVVDLYNLYTEKYPREIVVEREIVWIFYSIFECSLLTWIVRYRKNSLQLKSYFGKLAISITLWLTCNYAYGSSVLNSFLKVDPLSLFIILYQVYLVFYAARELLTLAEEQGKMTREPVFWIHVSIFFYAIGTFFIMAFLFSPILVNVYYINNIINITTHLLFLIGLSICFFSRTEIDAKSTS